MNQVQVRQVPVTPSTSPERNPGAWFPTGYYGHFRAKPRIELSNSFRQLARPTPPNKFVERQTSAATTHLFSDHDNRHKYEADALIRGAQKGIGRRRVNARVAGKFDPFLISWVPKNVDRNTYIDEVKISSYADDYSRDYASPSNEQPSTSSLSKSLPDIQGANKSPAAEGSIYSLGYSHGQPDPEHATQIRDETIKRYAGTRLRRAQYKHIDRSTSVATCLAWNTTDCENKPIKNTDKLINIDLPVPAPPPRVIAPVENNISQQNPYLSESMPTFKNTEQPRFDATPLREYYSVQIIAPLRRATSFVQPPTYTMEGLISKYM
ncbi:unnamed protein product [Adineta steineri]|nr:unnamed protein product [Adineta steineri]